MSLQIIWQTVADGVKTQLTVPLLEAELTITLLGDVIVDASWVIPDSRPSLTDTELAVQLKRYLLDPDRNRLQVSLLKQGSAYSQRVWQALLEIPLGQKMSYSALANKLGSGPRAVAQACRNNPYAGIIPCHRVVSKSGPGGFMGQSRGAMVDLKIQLLEYESEIVMNRP
ncbi:methylated-DNA--[protein]-cysteine S-methyltransferase [Methylomonas sp. LL1]|uniref:methylated-DNA--[protein]-cysteine S-methyltransferase n=1 Tax=Methylomonas sp. LL1 TaxID=2785785 RepID=UPI0018C4373A|nr:methylated-DNA--[protein]-cysteine S-methyltransferase [Methylomonas sp. LL1]QPK63147.1 methylated-DNA--[protein]-cysteine S-methyltransferase [Methylomonas sp. LL1]CAG1021972.1 Bifunctional transcriptional activator/DNA repair enzyme Ada [Methylococcales bacterium]